MLLASAVACGCGDDDYDPCAGLDCGDECQLCDPADPGCVETEVVKLCRADGICAAGPVTCPQASDSAQR